MPPVSFNETRITDLIEESLHDNSGHLDVFRIGDNLVVRTDLGQHWRLIPAGHTDTVPPSSSAEARIEGDVLWGVDSADMKGGLAAMQELDRWFQGVSGRRRGGRGRGGVVGLFGCARRPR
ncbi:MAG: M20/M25/M40 family metallo-hydrolase [bacterium]|nr:M20/M25/M40 family metallo-hydrolase [bacterium]